MRVSLCLHRVEAAPPHRLRVDQSVQHRFLRARLDVVHHLRPSHRVLGFHLLRHPKARRLSAHNLRNLRSRRFVHFVQVLRQPRFG